MLYERLIRPLLFRMDAEQAHEFAVRDLELLGRVPGGAAVLAALVAGPSPVWPPGSSAWISPIPWAWPRASTRTAA
ncbi:MAG: hypothetical protein PHU21_13320 [Elusimicrobia bacterium]|nr:hypothetical protein [Elusimicrobiota bacterium]